MIARRLMNAQKQTKNADLLTLKAIICKQIRNIIDLQGYT
jgi:hypothetical protein